MVTGKCPKCEKVCLNVLVEPIEVKEASNLISGKVWRGANYLCPFCRTILSSSLDPLSLKTDTVTSIVRKLKAGN